MTTVTLRPVTEPEFAEWMRETAEGYAAAQVAASNWGSEGAVERAEAETRKLLPEGRATPRTLLLRGVDEHGVGVGHVWIALDHPNGAPGTAFLFDFAVDEARRGSGLGRALLAAAEDAARAAGRSALALNVFGRNRVAVALYTSSGYEVTAQQMVKPLS